MTNTEITAGLRQMADDMGGAMAPAGYYADEIALLWMAADLIDSMPAGWQPIETAPKSGMLILLGAANGVWVGKYMPVYGSGFVPENPWSSMLLNHDHISNRYPNPTHWMPLPAPPTKEES